MTLKEREELVVRLVEKGFCSHYPGYTCNREWEKPGICNKCITSWIIRNSIKEKDLLDYLDS